MLYNYFFLQHDIWLLFPDVKYEYEFHTQHSHPLIRFNHVIFYPQNHTHTHKQFLGKVVQIAMNECTALQQKQNMDGH